MALPRPTPRQVAIGLDVFTGAVVLSVAVALAGLTWRMAGHAGTGAITVPDAGRLPVAAAPLPAAGAVAFQPFGRADPSDASQPTGLALELKGLVFARPAELASAFVSVSGAEPIPVKVGDSVGGATVQAIGRDRIILMNAGRSEYLAMPDPFAAPTVPGAPGVPGQPQGQAVPVPPPPIGAAPQAAPPPPSATTLLQRFNATPTAEGLRIGAGAPGGLRQGDVIQSVNGQSLADPAAAQGALAAAQASGAARVDIVRNGQRVTLTVPTR
jgi:general secretion pathway protein C